MMYNRNSVIDYYTVQTTNTNIATHTTQRPRWTGTCLLWVLWKSRKIHEHVTFKLCDSNNIDCAEYYRLHRHTTWHCQRTSDCTSATAASAACIYCSVLPLPLNFLVIAHRPILLPPPRRICNRRLFVCLLATLRKKLPNGFAWNFQRRLAMGQWPNDGDPNHGSGFDLDPDPYRETGKTCLGGGMHCPIASSLK